MSVIAIAVTVRVASAHTSERALDPGLASSTVSNANSKSQSTKLEPKYAGLLRRLCSPRPSKKISAIKSAKGVSDQAILDKLVTLLADRNADVRWEARTVLLERVDTVAALCNGMKHKSSAVRHAAMVLAFESQFESANVRKLIVRLTSDASISVRESAVLRCVSQALQGWEAVYTSARASEFAEIRASALTGIVFSGDSRAGKEVLRALRDSSGRVRAEAVRLLSSVYQPPWNAELFDKIEQLGLDVDKDPSVRLAVARQLPGFKLLAAANMLEQLGYDSDRRVAATAVSSLAGWLRTEIARK